MFWFQKTDVLKKSTSSLTKKSDLFWLSKIQTQLKNASFYQAFPSNKINATEYTILPDNSLNKHHKSVFPDKKKYVYLNDTEKCTNEGLSYHLFPNSIWKIKEYFSRNT